MHLPVGDRVRVRVACAHQGGNSTTVIADAPTPTPFPGVSPCAWTGPNGIATSSHTPGTGWSIMIGRCWLPPRAARPSLFDRPDQPAACGTPGWGELVDVQTVNRRLLAAAEGSGAAHQPQPAASGLICARPRLATRALRPRTVRLC